jgi:L-iditol 2-dehydrogenase
MIKGGSTFFVVNDLSLDQRMLLELAAVATHALQQGKSTGRLNFNSSVAVQGCGPVGLMMVAVLSASGVGKIIAIDGEASRLEFAKKLGAEHVVNFKEEPSLEGRVAAVKSATRGIGADFAYQCAGSPKAASDIYKYIRRGGGLCEMGFFVNNGDAIINPHFDLCNKEIALVGSWTYGAHEYPLTIAFLKRASRLGLPLEKMITHRFPLDKMGEAMETNLSMQGIKIAYVAG